MGTTPAEYNAVHASIEDDHLPGNAYHTFNDVAHLPICCAPVRTISSNYITRVEMLSGNQPTATTAGDTKMAVYRSGDNIKPKDCRHSGSNRAINTAGDS